jgi:hypothetical protein
VAATPSTRAAVLLPGYEAAEAVVLPALLMAALIVATIRIRRDRAFERAAARTGAEITDLRFKRVGPLDERDTIAYPLLRLTLPDG